MNLFGHLNLQQRFNWLIFVSIIFAGCLLMGLMYQIMSKYSNDYTNHYWREHTSTFSDSALYAVILGSTSQSEAVTHSFASDANVLKAAIYNYQHELLAFSGKSLDCGAPHSDFRNAFFMNTPDFWCFYSPIYQDGFLGYVELIISKAEYKAVMRQLLLGAVLVILLFSVIIFFIVRRLSGIFTSTLVEMAATLKNVSEGGRGDRVSFSGATEIDNMRVTLNNMLDTIELNEQVLEQRVEDRTSALRIALESSETAHVYKAQIMSMVSHEMKSPLHAISGYLQLLSERLPPDSKYGESRLLHSKALARVNDLNGLIDNILLHAKLEADRYEISFNPVALAPLMSACADNVTPLLNRNRNRLQFTGPEAMFVSDGEVLRHIVNNLLSNACKFTVDGDIALKWRINNAFLVIEVTDTGCGIPVEFHSNIFNAWWQVDMSLGRKYGGHGLGLAITKQFVQRLGGDISVASNGTRGTMFTVRVPKTTL
jgi:signal transduction histidine kinase